MRDDIKAAIANEIADKREKLLGRQEELARLIQDADREMRALVAQIGDLDAAARAFEISIPVHLEVRPARINIRGGTPTLILGTGTPGNLREALKAILKENHPRGMKVGELQAISEQRLGQKFHPKSAGMTLYRLSLKGFTKRDGFLWYYVPATEQGKPSVEGKPSAADEAAEGDSTLFDEKGGSDVVAPIG